MKNKFNKITSNPLFSGSTVMIVGLTSVSFLNYLYHLVMGRMLGPANYGELAAIISLVGLLGIIPGSLNLVVIKHISSARNKDEVSALIKWLKKKIFIASLIFSFIILIIAPKISSFLKIENGFYLILIAVSFVFSIQSLLNRSILQGLLKFRNMVTSMLTENFAKLSLSMLLVFFGFQVGGVMVALLVSMILGWYITNIYLTNYNKPQSDRAIDFKQILLFAFPVLIQSISITSIYSTDVVLVKHFFSSHDAGIYAALSNLGKIIFFGAGPIASVMFPIISNRYSRGEQYKKIFLYSILATSMIAASITLFYNFFPSFAINILYGNAYLSAARLLVWFAIFISLFTLSSLMISFNLSLERTKVVVIPLTAAIAQFVFIWIYHQTILQVVLISATVNALLLICLLIYSIYQERGKLWK